MVDDQPSELPRPAHVRDDGTRQQNRNHHSLKNARSCDRATDLKNLRTRDPRKTGGSGCGHWENVRMTFTFTFFDRDFDFERVLIVEYDDLQHVPQVGHEIFIPDEALDQPLPLREPGWIADKGVIKDITWSLPDEVLIYCDIIWEVLEHKTA